MNAIVTSALRFTASLWLAGATVAIADPALAARSIDGRPQVVVNVADLNLQVPAGRATAQRRLRAAALTVCDSGEPKGDQACVDRAISQGQQAIGVPVAGQIAAR